jgi:hypothetical protein
MYLTTSNLFFSRYGDVLKKMLKKPFVAFASPFFVSPGCENSAHKKTLATTINVHYLSSWMMGGKFQLFFC